MTIDHLRNGRLIANVMTPLKRLTPDGSFLLNVSPIPDEDKEIIPLDAIAYFISRKEAMH